MKRRLDKNTFYFHYQPYDFPSDLYNEEALRNKDMIFNDERSEPLLMNTTLKNEIRNTYAYLPKYYYEKTKNKRGGGGGNINTMEQSNDYNGNYINSNKEDQLNEKVEDINSNKVISSIQVSQQYEIQNGINYTIKPVNKTTAIQVPLESLFEDSKLKTNGKEPLPKVENTMEILDDTELSIDTKIVNIDRIYRVNDCLNYSNNSPLWYIYHPVGKSSFGPLSSINIEEMYNKKALNGEYKIRFIDIYTIEDIEPFNYFKLKDIEKSGFIDKIAISPKVTEANNSIIKRSKGKRA